MFDMQVRDACSCVDEKHVHRLLYSAETKDHSNIEARIRHNIYPALTDSCRTAPSELSAHPDAPLSVHEPMRRFLGGNLATSTGASGQGALNGPSNGNNGSTPESSSSNYVASGSQSMAAAATAAASASAATRRALQTTWQQFRANSTKSSTSQSSDAEKSSSNGKDSVSCTSSAEIERIDGMERKAQSQSSEASADSVQEDWNSMLLPFSERTKTTANEMDSPAQMPPMPTRNYAKLDVSTRYTANASSMVDLKNEMLLELLSSDAMVHVGDFEILGLDEVEDLRKVGNATRCFTGRTI